MNCTPEPNPLGIRPEANDEAFWQEQWTEDHFTFGPCDGKSESVVSCLMDQRRAEQNRAFDARRQIAEAKAAERQDR
jgi:hypothetical protein